MNKLIFKRKSTIGLITLALGILFIYYGTIHTEYNFIPPVIKYITGGVTIIYAIWQFLVPYVIIDDLAITVKKDIFSTTTIEIEQLNNISLYGNEIELKTDVYSVRIKLSLLAAHEREKLRDKINELHNQ